MTIIKDHKLVTRETAAYYRGRPLIVRLRPRYIEVREKGRRDVLEVDYLVLYDFAQKLRWRKQQAEKREMKLAKSKRAR